MLETVLSVSALMISIITFWITFRRSNRINMVNSYLAIERDSSRQIFFPLLEHDYLNLLFYLNPKSPPPNPGTLLEDMTEEQRAIFNYGTVTLDYFEQLFLLRQYGFIPKEIPQTWDLWLDECVRAPYFKWVWDELNEHYHPFFQKALESKISNINTREN